MYKTIYTKFSEGRRKEYSVCTSIIEELGEKKILKKAQFDCGHKHLEHMLSYYLNCENKIDNKNVKYCKCSRLDSGTIVFDYIDGVSYAEKIIESAQKQDYDKIIELLQDIKTMIYGSVEHVPFQRNDVFKEIFGDIEIDEAMIFGNQVNVDLIAENIISKDMVNYIIDYEWILDCIIPLDFVFFRCVMHNMEIAKLGVDFQERIYEHFQITKEQRDIYTMMEFRFQKHIKGESYSLEELYNEMPNECYRLQYQDWGSALNKCSVYVAEQSEKQMLCQKIQFSDEFEICIDVSGINQIELHLLECNGIIKLKSLFGYSSELKKENIDYHTNADLVICEDYYFYDKPVMTCNCEHYDQIQCSYTILDKNNRYIPFLADTLRQNNVVKLENAALNGEIQATKEVYEKEINNTKQMYEDQIEATKEMYESNIEMIQDRYETELNTIKNRKAWKLIMKIDRLRDKMRR